MLVMIVLNCGSCNTCPVNCIDFIMSLAPSALTILKTQCLCVFLLALLRGRTGRRMAEGSRSFKSVWWELWRLPGKRGVSVHTDPNPEGSGRKASRNCHTNHEEKKQTSPDSWCQRYLQAPEWLKGKSRFLIIILFDAGRKKGGTCMGVGRRGGCTGTKGIFPEDF